MIRHIRAHRANDAAIVDHLREVRQRIAHLDAALALLVERKRRRHEAAGLAFFVELVGGRLSREFLQSAGLGSNVSTCEGPPLRNRKITRLARGVKCGRRAEPAARTFCGSSRPRRLTRPNPPHMRPSIARRDIGATPGRTSFVNAFVFSIDIKHLVAGQEHLGILLPAGEFGTRRPRKEIERQLDLRRLGGAGEEQVIRPIDCGRLLFRVRVGGESYAPALGAA